MELWELVGTDDLEGSIFGYFTSERLANIGLAHLPEELRKYVKVLKNNLSINTVVVNGNAIYIEDEMDSEKIPVIVRKELSRKNN